MSVDREHVSEGMPAGGVGLEADLWLFRGGDRYQAISFVGSGAMGRGYRNLDRTVGRVVALKLIIASPPAGSTVVMTIPVKAVAP